jgi:hypothetical protein
MALAVLPGLGHVLLHRRWKGTLLFLGFLAALDLASLSAIHGTDTTSFPFWIGALVAASLIVYSLRDAQRILFPRRRDALAALVHRHFREGVRHYLRAEYPEARNEFRGALDLDPLNREARLYLGMILKQERRLEEAHGMLRGCLEDDGGKWEWELRRELERIGTLLPPTEASASGGPDSREAEVRPATAQEPEGTVGEGASEDGVEAAGSAESRRGAGKAKSTAG